jgi:hypothetical protein
MFAAAPMIQKVEVVVDATGNVRLLVELRVNSPRRALAADCSRPEEDAAWSYLQPAK